MKRSVSSVVLWILVSIVVLIAASSVVLVSDFLVHSPPTPSLSSNPTELDNKTKEIQNYKDLTAAMQDRTKNMYQLVVVNTLLPIFQYLLTAFAALFVTQAAIKGMRSYYLARWPSSKNADVTRILILNW